MNTSLTLQCIKEIESSNIKNIYEVIPSDLYHTYVDYLCSQNFLKWKNKIKLVNLEVNLEDMEVEQDMYFDEPTFYERMISMHKFKRTSSVDMPRTNVSEHQQTTYPIKIKCVGRYNIHLRSSVNVSKSGQIGV